MTSVAPVARATHVAPPQNGPGTGLAPVPAIVPAAVPAAVPASAPTLPAAEAIGSEFVAQYYAAMHARLDQLHRFYAEDSSLFVADGSDDGAPLSSTGLRAIDDALRGLASRRERVVVATVDALHSAHGAVVVVVTGTAARVRETKDQSRKRNTPEDFAQTFVLAPQRNGFYVKNDLVRFLGRSVDHPRPDQPYDVPIDVVQRLENAVNDVDSAAASPPPPPNPPRALSFPVPALPPSVSLETIEAEAIEAAKRSAASSAPAGSAPAPKVVPPPSSGALVPRAEPELSEVSEKVSEPTGPPSYASALLKARAAATAAASGGPAVAIARATRAKTTASDGFTGSRFANAPVPANPIEAPVTCVFVRGFPGETSVEDLRRAFSVFGAVKDDGVSLRVSKTQKSATEIEKHAFVEFVDARGASNALREKQPEVLGVSVGVEAKRGTARRGASAAEAEAESGDALGGGSSRGPRRRGERVGERGRAGGRQGEGEEPFRRRRARLGRREG